MELLAHWGDVLSAQAAIESAFATVVLAFTAIVAGFIAYTQLKDYQKTERTKYTFKQVHSYFKGFTDLPSPFRALTQLDEIPPDPEIAGITHNRAELDKYVRRVSELFTVLQNYLDESEDLLERGIIDADLFMGRQYRIIKDTVSVLRRFSTVMSFQYADALLNRIEARALDYEQRHP
jgi:hypothetical protein